MPASSRALLGVAAVSAIGFIALAVITSGSMTPGGPEVAFDAAVLDWVVAHRGEPATTLFVVVTWIGSIPALAPLLALIGWSLYRRRGFEPMRWLVITAVGANALHILFIVIFARPRPPLGLRLYAEASWSFPSGHATQAIAVAVMAAVVLGEGRSRAARGSLVGVAVLYALVVGLSRIYLGAHWATDVLGGFALGTAWVALVLVVRARRAGTVA